MADRYGSFAGLQAAERKGVDYDIRFENLESSIIVLAPHGGLIEPGTSELTQAIAGRTLSYYVFEGLRPRPHRDLHITSTRFDEPTALQLVGSADTAIAVHGRSDDGTDEVWVGGLDQGLRGAVATALIAAGFQAFATNLRLSGSEPTNICNRCASGKGVQLELPRTLRGDLLEHGHRMHSFAAAVRDVLPAIRCGP